MRVLLVGAGGVGSSIVRIAGRRFVAARVDAADAAGVVELLRTHRCDVLLNATDPRFVLPLFRAALEADADYLDMAMSPSPRQES